MKKRLFIALLIVWMGCGSAVGATTPEEFQVLEQKICALMNKGELDSALVRSSAYTELALQENNILEIVQGYYLQAWVFHMKKAYGQAIALYLEAVKYAEGSEDPQVFCKLTSLYKNISSIMSRYAQYQTATRFADQGLELAHQMGDTSQIIDLQFIKSKYLRSQKRFDESIELNQQTIPLCEENSKKFLKLSISLGITHFERTDYAMALETFQKTLAVARTTDHETYTAALLNNIGEVLYRQGKHREALAYLEDANQIKRGYSPGYDLIDGLKTTGLNYIALRDYPAALARFMEAAQHLEKIQLFPDYFDLYKHMSELLHTMVGQQDLALEYEKKYREHKKTYEDTQATLQLSAGLLLQVEGLLKDKEVFSVRAWRTIFIVAGFSIFLFIGLFYLYRRTAKMKQPAVAVSTDRQLMTRQELARELGISYHTLRRRLVESDLRISSRKYLKPSEQQAILDYLKK